MTASIFFTFYWFPCSKVEKNSINYKKLFAYFNMKQVAYQDSGPLALSPLSPQR